MSKVSLQAQHGRGSPYSEPFMEALEAQRVSSIIKHLPFSHLSMPQAQKPTVCKESDGLSPLRPSVWLPFQDMELSSIGSQRAHHGKEGPKDSSTREEVFRFLFVLLGEIYVSSSYRHPLLLTDSVVLRGRSPL